ncbi:neurotrypsin-like [Halichondria panicea]|uniref:neurotrypsin-like n=1 Tax=Halichondria panicea TaxID=6063 RepID=UPI00312B3000
MKLLLIVFYFLEFANCQEAQEPIQGNCNNNNVGDLRLVHNSGGNFGAIQVCQDISWSNNDQWRYFSSNGAWTDRAARLACRQLNLGYLSATTSTMELTRQVFKRVIESCSCVETTDQLSNCITDDPRQITVATVNCRNGNSQACSIDGAMRLVGGSTVSEGRLEICHNGQWGTICNQGWTDSRAAQVCSTLGLPTYNATLHQFNGGAGSVYTYNCTTMDSDISNCIQESSCAHSMDVGVKCLPFTDACAVQVNKVIATSGTLGALIGLSAAALVVVITGWIVSCVYFQRKINKKCKDHTHTTPASTSDPNLQLNNPVYDGSTTVPHTTYSSHGPSYEVIDTNEGAGHSHDAISHRGGARPHPPTTPTVSNEEYSTLDTNRENDEYHTLESNTGDAQYSMVGHTDPQDYEVPAPPQEEEYSTLKHR